MNIFNIGTVRRELFFPSTTSRQPTKSAYKSARWADATRVLLAVRPPKLRIKHRRGARSSFQFCRASSLAALSKPLRPRVEGSPGLNALGQYTRHLLNQTLIAATRAIPKKYAFMSRRRRRCRHRRRCRWCHRGSRSGSRSGRGTPRLR